MIIPISEFAPDQPDGPGNYSDTILNVLPLTQNSYGPLPSLQAYSSALSARCQGALSVQDSSGNVRVFAGDATKLYRLTSATPADVSKVGNYSTPSTGIWSLALFGTRVIATNFVDPPQSYVEGTSALFADMISTGVTSLKAKYVAIVRDFVVLGYTTDSTYGTQSQRVWWLAINDPTNAPTPGTQAAANAQSDFQDNVGDHGELTGIAGNLGLVDAAIFYKRAIYRMIYVGLPNIFDFQRVTGNRGLICPGGLVQLDNIAYFISEDGFYKTDGSTALPIGKFKVDNFFYADFDSNYADRVSSAFDPKLGVVAWSYPGQGSTGGTPNRILFFSPNLDRWAATDTGAVNAECLIRGATFGATLEDLDAFGTIDSLAFSLDSPVWGGARNILAAFDTTHKFAYFNGANLAASIVTTDFEPVPGHQALTSRVRPLSDTTACTVSGAGRDRIMDPVSYGTTNSMQTNGTVPIRTRGRYQRMKMQIPATTAWTNVSGIDIEETVVSGKR